MALDSRRLGTGFIKKGEITLKLWLDDCRPAPEGYVWVKSVNEAKTFILDQEREFAYLFRRGIYKADYLISLIDLDHDAGDFANDGGDYIKLLDWLEETGRDYPIRIHSMNPVGCANMRRIIERNGWKEIR